MRLGAGGVVIDKQTVLDVLTGIGEVSAELGQIAAGAVVGGRLTDAYGFAAETGLGGADGGVATNFKGNLSPVDSSIIPLLDEKHRSLCTVANAECPVLTEVSHATVTHDDGNFGMVTDLDDYVVVAGDFIVVTGDGDFDRGLEGGLGWDDDAAIDGVRVSCGQGRQTILRSLGQFLQLTRGQVGDGDAVSPLDVDVDDAGLLTWLEGDLGQNRYEGLNRGEPPNLLTPGGHGVVSDLP